MAGADDVGLVRQLLAGPGDGTLPSLTREELFALGDEPVLAHAGDTQWWSALDVTGTQLVAGTAQRGLLARNLLTADPAATDGALLIDGRVRVILRARREPSWLVVLGEPANTDVRLVAAGIDLAAGETAAVLVSARLEGIYLNRLVGAGTAVDVLVEWLLRPPSADADHPTGRTVELISPRHGDAGDTVGSTRAIVLGDGAQWVIADVDDTGPGEPRATGTDELRNWLRDALPL